MLVHFLSTSFSGGLNMESNHQYSYFKPNVDGWYRPHAGAICGDVSLLKACLSLPDDFTHTSVLNL